MSKSIPTDQWILVGSSSNASFYIVSADLLAVVPNVNCEDNETTARESLAFQAQHWKSLGHRGAAAIFMDNVLKQDGGARNVYENETSNHLTSCFALVGETFFGQAVASVFTGLTKPGIPTRLFRSLDEARPWIAEMNRERGGPV